LKIAVYDIGNSAIKSLYFEKKYKGYNLVSVSNNITIEDSKLSSYEKITKTLLNILEKTDFVADKVIIINSISKDTNRFLTLPFRDKRRLKEVLPLELEDTLPFDIDEIIYDWEVIKHIERSTNVFVDIFNKLDFKPFLESLNKANVNPDVVTTGGESLFHLINYIDIKKEEKPKIEKKELEKPKNEDGVKDKKENKEDDSDFESLKPYAIIDFGASKTRVLIVRNSYPELMRSINYGGNHITNKIKESYNQDFVDAERAKKEVGFIIIDENIDYSEEQIKFSSTLKEGYDLIIRDINQTISSYKSEYKENIENIYVSGGAWQVDNFLEYLENEIKIKVSKLRYYEKLGVELPFLNKVNETVFVNSIGAFLNYTGKSKFKGLNFRKDEFSKYEKGKSGFLNVLSLFKKSIRNIIITLFFVIAYMIAHYYVLDSNIETLNNNIREKFNKVFLDKGSKSKDIILSTKARLEKEIKTRMKKEKALLSGELKSEKLSSFLILRDISYLIPKNLVVDITSLKIVKDKINIKGLVSSQASFTKLVNLMKKDLNFEKIEASVLNSNKNEIEFEISAYYNIKKVKK
jgi:Tfp pilus assembly PilM family ATPase/Tfp pilus assembly protein PilN